MKTIIENKNQKEKFIATTLSGLEEVLMNELVQLGAENTMVLTRAVYFEGDKELMYKANIRCRTALYILQELGGCDISDIDDVYEASYRIAWEDYFRKNDTFSVSAKVNKCEFINDTRFAALKVKDAIVDRLRNVYGERPNVDKHEPTIFVSVHIFKNKLSLYLNTSGEPLFKRGYKKHVVSSPLNEVLAAGMISLAGWNNDKPLYDPFCGSGTILLEAAMMAAEVAPGLYRNFYAFKNNKLFDVVLYDRLINEAKSAIKYEIQPVCGSDIDRNAVNIAKENIESAGFGDFIKIERHAFGEKIPKMQNGCIITNPPYGVRTDGEGLESLYKNMGDTFKRQFKGFTCWLITSDIKALNAVGLHASPKYHLFNGALECRFVCYKMY